MLMSESVLGVRVAWLHIQRTAWPSTLHLDQCFFNLFSEAEPFVAILIAHGTHVF